MLFKRARRALPRRGLARRRRRRRARHARRLRRAPEDRRRLGPVALQPRHAARGRAPARAHAQPGRRADVPRVARGAGRRPARSRRACARTAAARPLPRQDRHAAPRQRAGGLLPHGGGRDIGFALMFNRANTPAAKAREDRIAVGDRPAGARSTRPETSSPDAESGPALRRRRRIGVRLRRRTPMTAMKDASAAGRSMPRARAAARRSPRRVVARLRRRRRARTRRPRAAKPTRVRDHGHGGGQEEGARRSRRRSRPGS